MTARTTITGQLASSLFVQALDHGWTPAGNVGDIVEFFLDAYGDDDEGWVGANVPEQIAPYANWPLDVAVDDVAELAAKYLAGDDARP